ncbi:MAG: HAD family hydrolase [Acidobacteriota bacterium]
MTLPHLAIDTLFLDAGGVLCHPSWPRVSAALADQGVEVSPEAPRRAEPYAKKSLDEASVVGTTTDASRGWLYFDLVLAHAGISPSEATRAALVRLREYHQAENLWEHVPADVPPALERLRGLGLSLVVVSNANGRLRHLFARVGLARYVDAMLDSHEWGVEKPDPRLFQLALEQVGAHPARTAHIGDLFHVDVAGARAAGLQEGVLLDPWALYGHADCRRVQTLDELAASVIPRRDETLVESTASARESDPEGEQP